MHKFIDAQVALAHMLTTVVAGTNHLHIVDGYLVYWTIQSPWYSNATYLSELLIVRVEEGGTFRGVANFLRDAAIAHGADLVAVGTALARSDAALSRLYQAEGFTPEATLLTLEP